MKTPDFNLPRFEKQAFSSRSRVSRAQDQMPKMAADQGAQSVDSAMTVNPLIGDLDAAAWIPPDSYDTAFRPRAIVEQAEVDGVMRPVDTLEGMRQQEAALDSASMASRSTRDIPSLLAAYRHADQQMANTLEDNAGDRMAQYRRSITGHNVIRDMTDSDGVPQGHAVEEGLQNYQQLRNQGLTPDEALRHLDRWERRDIIQLINRGIITADAGDRLGNPGQGFA